MSVMDLARVYQSAQQYPEAEAMWKRALALLEKVVEPDHYRLLKPLKGYAELLDGRRDQVVDVRPLRHVAFHGDGVGPEFRRHRFRTCFIQIRDHHFRAFGHVLARNFRAKATGRTGDDRNLVR